MNDRNRERTRRGFDRRKDENEVVEHTRGTWGEATLGRSGLGGGMRNSGMATFGWSDFDAGSGGGGWRTRRSAPRRTAGPDWESSDRVGHSGRGPKGYRRDDARIHEDACERLKHDDAVDASDIEVRVENGVVILSGTVSDRRSKRRAESCIEDISGVDDVTNQLRLAASRADSSR